MYIKITRKTLSFCCGTVLLSAITATAGPATDWSVAREQQGIRVELRSLEDSEIQEYRGTVTLPVSLDTVVAVLHDIEACPQWVHQCISGSLLLELGFRERYIHQITDFPFPAINREVIFHARIEQQPGSRTLTVRLTAAPDFCNQQQLPGCNGTNLDNHVQIRVSHGSYRLEPVDDQRTRVTWQQHVEPAGKLPDWMVNAMLVDMPFQTLRNLTRLVQNPGYQRARLQWDSDGRVSGFSTGYR